MRPPTPNLSYLSAYIRDPLELVSFSPVQPASPIDSLVANYLAVPTDSGTMIDTVSPLIHQARAQQQQHYTQQQQQCIPGLAQIYAPLSRNAEAPAELAPRKRASATAAAQRTYTPDIDDEDEDEPLPPPTKRQRAAPSGPISTKDWVPPDVSGLNKREARLVKNRAAAFLSRQRKREEFELMEVRVQELEAENARLRGSAPPPASDAQMSSDSQDPTQQLVAQLADAQAREDALAAQLRDLRATLTQQQQQSPQQSMRSPLQTHNPQVSHWPQMPTASAPLAPIVKTEADDDMRVPTAPDSHLMRAVPQSSDEGEGDLKRMKRKQAVVRGCDKEKTHTGHGSVAFMVLLFSLSLLSSKDETIRLGARRGTTAHDATAPFAFELNPGVNGGTSATASSFEYAPHPSIKSSHNNKPSGGDPESTSWKNIDSLDDDFDYFGDRSAAAPSELGLGLGGWGSTLGLGLGLGMDDDQTTYPAYGDLQLDYPALSSPFSLSSSLSADTLSSVVPTCSSSFGSPVTGYRRGDSPSASSTTTTTRRSTSTRNTRGKALEVSLRPHSATTQQSGETSFDLHIASAPTDEDDDEDESSIEETTQRKRQEQTLTVRVRSTPSDAAPNATEMDIDHTNIATLQKPKNKIVLELSSASTRKRSSPSSSFSSTTSKFENDNDDEDLLDLNADFAALLGQVSQGLGFGSGDVQDTEQGPRWRVALAEAAR